MAGGMAIFEIGENGSRRAVRVFIRPKDEKNLSDDEIEAKEAILEEFLKPEYAGKVGNTLDPYKITEKILTERYGHAKMVETHFEWRPNIRY
ncbi:hypothetical protein [Slackia sp.]